jgi:hypothetical protein
VFVVEWGVETKGRCGVIFESLMESVDKGELILIDGGYCRWHLRRDGQITIYEIIATRRGAGAEMLSMLMKKGATSILARCPSDLSANGWYDKMGFEIEEEYSTSSGREIKIWRLQL